MAKSKIIIKVMSLVLVIVTMFSITAVSASAATWRTGNIPSYNRDTGYTTVRLSSTKKDAKIKIHTYYINPLTRKSKEGNSRLYVTMRDTNGRWIWGGNIDTGSKGKTMTLGRDHSVYRIYLREVQCPGIWYYRTFNTYHYPDYWGIECTKNCYI